MKIIAWIVVVLYVIKLLVNFSGVFTNETVKERVHAFIGVIESILICVLCIYIIRV